MDDLVDAAVEAVVFVAVELVAAPIGWVWRKIRGNP